MTNGLTNDEANCIGNFIEQFQKFTAMTENTKTEFDNSTRPMKRIIKFRGKDISQDIWYEGSLYQDEMVSSIMFQGKDGVDYNMIVDPETVAQFTGLTDNNGNEICEGDIVGFQDGTAIGKVVWSEFNSQFIMMGKTIEQSMSYTKNNYVIIGNINDKK